MIYLDSSALMKLLVDEAESAQLEDYLRARPDSAKVSSELAQTEVVRACRRRDDPALLGHARLLLTGVDLVPVTRALIDLAGEVGQPALRTLDAIHLACARNLGGGLSTLVTYDVRLASACRAEGVPTAQPGA